MNLFPIILSIGVIVSASLLLFSSNKVYSVMYLILIYMCTSILMMYLGVVVLGIFYFLVYIGAVAVLFLFSIMILDLKEFLYERDYSFFIYMLLFILLFSIQAYLLLKYINVDLYGHSYEYFYNTTEILFIIGLITFKRYSFLLVLAGLILLVSMIGSIYLTNYKRGFYVQKQALSLSRNYTIYYSSIY